MVKTFLSSQPILEVILQKFKWCLDMLGYNHVAFKHRMSYLHSDSYNEFIRCDVEYHKKLGMSSLNTNRFLNKKFKIQSNNWCQSQGS